MSFKIIDDLKILQNKFFDIITTYSIEFKSDLYLTLSFLEFMIIISLIKYELNLISDEHLYIKTKSILSKNKTIIDNKRKISKKNSKNQIVNFKIDVNDSLEHYQIKIQNENKIKIILISDDTENYYPFFYLKFENLCINMDAYPNIKNLSDLKTNIYMNSFNFITSTWEPIIEKMTIKIELDFDLLKGRKNIFIRDYLDINEDIQEDYSNEINNELNNQNNKNLLKNELVNEDSDITISDMAIESLYINFNKWIINFYGIKKESNKNTNNKIEITKNKTVTNHRIYNYSGFKINFIDKKGNFTTLENNNFFDVPFNAYSFSSYDKIEKIETYKFFIDNCNFDKNKINLDNIKTTKYTLLTSNLERTPIINGQRYLISKNEIRGVKKVIYFYSPLIFKNNTLIDININLLYKDKKKSKKYSLKYVLKPNEIYGVPLEYFDGEIEIKPKDYEEMRIDIQILFSNIEMNNQLICNNKYLLMRTALNENEENCEEIKKYKESIKKNKKLNNKLNESILSFPRIIYFQYPYIIKNCLPFILKIRIKDKRGNVTYYNLKKGDSLNLESFPINSNLNVNLQIPNITKETKVILYDIQDNVKNKIKKIGLIDLQGNPIIINSLVYSEEQRLIVLFSDRVLINLGEFDSTMTKLNFLYGKNEENLTPIPGMTEISNIFMLNSDEPNLWISSHNYLSEKLIIKELNSVTEITCNKLLNNDPNNNNNIITNKENEKMYKYILESKISLINKDMNLYCNILVLRPKYYLVNQTEFCINISVHGNPNKKFFLLKGSRTVFNFFGLDNNTLFDISLSLYEDNNYVLFETIYPINIIDTSMQTFKLIDIKSREVYWFLNILRVNEEVSTILNFKQSNEKISQILIQNKIDDKIIFYQDITEIDPNMKKNKINVNGKEEKITTWDIHTKGNKNFIIKIPSNNIIKNFTFVNNKICGYKLPCNFQMGQIIKDNLEPKQNIICSFSYEYFFQLKIIIEYTNLTDTLNILSLTKTESIEGSEESTEPNETDDLFSDILEIQIIFKKLGFSLIMDNRNIYNSNSNNYIRKELIFILFENVIFLFSKKIYKTCDYLINYHYYFVIENILIGNQTGYDLYYPKIFVPIVDDDETYPLLNIIVRYKKNFKENLIMMKILNFTFQPFELRIESDFAYDIYNFVENVTVGIKTTFTDIHPIYQLLPDVELIKKYNCYIKDNNIQFMIENDSNSINKKYNTNNLFIEKIDITSFDINFSFYNKSTDFLKNLIQVNKIFTGVLETLTTVEDIKMQLNGCYITNFNGSSKDLIKAIYQHYKSHIFKHLLRIFMGIEAIGNPHSVFNNISKGVKDLFKKPQKGFEKSALHGVAGIALGGGSLVRHTIKSTMGMTSKIISGVSKNILKISMDKNYIKNRELNKVKERPKNAIEGVGYGIKSLSKGIFDGVTGIIRQPVNSLKEKKNFSSFGKGLIKGITGVISKPVGGVLDLVSKTTEGIQNNVKIKSEIFHDIIIRYPRPFYGRFKFIKNFDEYDAFVIQVLSKTWKEFRKNNYYFCNSMKIHFNNGKNFLLVITNEKIAFFDEEDFEINNNYMYKIKGLNNLALKDTNLIFDYGENCKIYSLKQIELEKQKDILYFLKKEIQKIDENFGTFN